MKYTYEIENDFFRVVKPHFYGKFKRSQNGNYLFAWEMPVRLIDKNGNIKSRSGAYILMEKNTILLWGKIKNPDNCCVANNGNFVTVDFGRTNSLNCTLYVFNKAGLLLYQEKFRANIMSTGISDNGRFVVVQTAHSKFSSHDSVLSMFDLLKNTTLLKEKNTAWVYDYKIEIINGRLHLLKDGSICKTYNFIVS